MRAPPILQEFRKSPFISLLGLAAFASYAVYVIIKCLFSVHGWMAGQFLASVDRIRKGSDLYPALETSLMPASTGYSPGMIFLLIIGDWILGPLKDIHLSLLASFNGFLLLFSIVLFSFHIGVSLNTALLGSAFLFTFVFRHLWHEYISDLRPEVLLLALSFLTSLLMLKAESEQQFFWQLPLLILLLVMIGLLKQTGMAVFVGLFLYLFLASKSPGPVKIYLAGTIALSALLVYLIHTLVPNCFDHVVAMTRHPLRPLKSLRYDIAWTLREMWPVYLPVLVWAVRQAGNGFKPAVGVSSTGLILWGFVCLPYIGTLILSNVKYGGNISTLEISSIALTPIVLFSLEKMISITLPRSSYNFLFIVLCGLVVGVNSFKIHSVVSAYRAKSLDNAAARSYLTKNFSGLSVIYPAEWYTLVREASLKPVTDTYTLVHFAIGGRVSKKVLEAIRTKKYDVALGHWLWEWHENNQSPGVWREYFNALKENYTPLPADDLPKMLKGQVWIPRR